MKRRIPIWIALFVLGVFLVHLPFSCQRIDAGHAGIKVNLYGTEKGVNDIHEVTGMVWYNPYIFEVYEVPTYVQTATYENEGKGEENHEFNITTQDGINVQFDLSINYYTPDENVVAIFKKYRKPVYELEGGVLRNFLKDAFNNVANGYTAEELYSSRARFEQESEERLEADLTPEGFILEQAVILGKLRYPEAVYKNIQGKVDAEQVALKKEQEVVQAKFDAQKKVEKMRGDSTALVGMAAAEAHAYKIKKMELNELLVKQQWIEAWEEGGSQVPHYVSGDGSNSFIFNTK